MFLLIVTMLCFVFPARSADLKINEDQKPKTVIDKIYEAEEAVLLDSILTLQDSSASGGNFCQMRKTGSVLFNVSVEETGRVAITIGYRSSAADRAQHILINGIEYAPEIGFPRSISWTEIEKSAGLKTGENTIELRASRGELDIDYIRVEGPIFEPPEITPKNNTFYIHETSSDLTIQLEKNHNPFIGITILKNDIPYKQEPVSYIEDAVSITVPNSYLQTLETGPAEFLFHFGNTEPVSFQLNVRDVPYPTDWIIVSLDVSHGTAVLMLLPTGKTLLIDTGTETMCRERVIPFLDRHQINLDYVWITHYHEDHCGGERLLLDRFTGLIKKDYHDFATDEQFEFEGIRVTILNSYNDGTEELGENSRSLSMRMEYRGFVYTHGGDIYGWNQHEILHRYVEKNQLDQLKTHIYHANHHFHGSVDVAYLRMIDPYLFIVSGEEHIYGRGAYTQQVKKNVLNYLKENNERLIEDLLSFEVGHIIIRVSDRTHWNYETVKDLDAVISFLKVSQTVDADSENGE